MYIQYNIIDYLLINGMAMDKGGRVMYVKENAAQQEGISIVDLCFIS